MSDGIQCLLRHEDAYIVAFLAGVKEMKSVRRAGPPVMLESVGSVRSGKFLLALASTDLPVSESHGTHNHILLSRGSRSRKIRLFESTRLPLNCNLCMLPLISVGVTFCFSVNMELPHSN
jgi:hypothetical protein